MKQNPYFLSENIQENAKLTGMIFMMKHFTYFLLTYIQNENARMTGIMFNEASSIFFVKKPMTMTAKQFLSSIALIGP